jgi:hypothetical protein
MTKQPRQFSFFPQLPRELQLKIFKHSLEAPRATPRIVQAIYDETTSSVSYRFTIPPALQVCYLSRLAALETYHSLVPTSPYPIYINPHLDYLYCKSPLTNTAHPWNHPPHPLLESSADVSSIRFLLIDHDYWERTGLANSQLQIFQNLELLFDVELSVEQWWRRAMMRFSPKSKYMWKPPPLEMEDNPLRFLYEEELARAREAERSVVPGYSVCDHKSYPIYTHGNTTEPWDLDPERVHWKTSPKVLCIRATPDEARSVSGGC